MQVTLFAVSY